jgi:hypothetical protein
MGAGMGAWPVRLPLCGFSFRLPQLRFVGDGAPVICRRVDGMALAALAGDPPPPGGVVFEVVSVFGVRLGFLPDRAAGELAEESLDARLDLSGVPGQDRRAPEEPAGADVIVLAPRLDPGPEQTEALAALASSRRRRQAAVVRDRFVHDDGWRVDRVRDGRLVVPRFTLDGALHPAG